MKKTLALILIFFCFSNATLFGQSAQQEVQQADKDLNNWISQNNGAKAEEFYLPDFVLTVSSGSEKSKTEILREIASPELKLEINETSEVTVRVFDSTAILTGVLHQKGMYKDKSFDVRLRVTDTWVKTSEGWKIFAGHASMIPTTPSSTK